MPDHDRHFPWHRKCDDKRKRREHRGHRHDHREHEGRTLKRDKH